VIRTRSEEETIAFGEELAARLPPGCTVALIGNLGAGKTTLAKGIAKGLGAAEPDEVSSPTFTLVHEYGDPVRVYHVDLYRIEQPREAAGLGLNELFDSGAVVLIEWAERFPELLPESRAEVRLRRVGDEEREIDVTGLPVSRQP
jgi:tRNA threonylcarbamoyladenosine biosynthesis protein TsaE